MRCLHTYAPGEFAKIYDAVIEVTLNDSRVRFALEYEATQKTITRYQKVLEEIESDTRLDTFLYIVPTWDLLHALTRHIRSSKKCVVFGLLDEFKKRRWDATVCYFDFVSRPLRNVLVGTVGPP